MMHDEEAERAMARGRIAARARAMHHVSEDERRSNNHCDAGGWLLLLIMCCALAAARCAPVPARRCLSLPPPPCNCDEIGRQFLLPPPPPRRAHQQPSAMVRRRAAAQPGRTAADLMIGRERATTPRTTLEFNLPPRRRTAPWCAHRRSLFNEQDKFGASGVRSLLRSSSPPSKYMADDAAAQPAMCVSNEGGELLG